METVLARVVLADRMLQRVAIILRKRQSFSIDLYQKQHFTSTLRCRAYPTLLARRLLTRAPTPMSPPSAGRPPLPFPSPLPTPLDKPSYVPKLANNSHLRIPITCLRQVSRNPLSPTWRSSSPERWPISPTLFMRAERAQSIAPACCCSTGWITGPRSIAPCSTPAGRSNWKSPRHGRPRNKHEAEVLRGARAEFRERLGGVVS
ncbi:Uncharacterized protein pbN1_41340 [Aromatoleum bremense]|nr:Uncharacterized protein pbN1_41340 [Aromatoleum bremense]